jgi:cytochrome c553
MKSIASLLIAAALAAPALSSLAEEAKADAPAPAAPAAAKPDLAQGAAKYATVCAACHGADGNSGIPANPTLAQQHPEYLAKQLQDFKSGKRASPIMQGMAAMLSDADVKNVAYWAASQKAKPGAAKDKNLVLLGEKIYRGGIADKQVAACAGCHSPNAAGIPAQYPRLSGQHADYTEAQLKAFREVLGAPAGTPGRANSAQMSQVAARLSDREIKAVADYIAGLR